MAQSKIMFLKAALEARIQTMTRCVLWTLVVAAITIAGQPSAQASIVDVTLTGSLAFAPPGFSAGPFQLTFKIDQSPTPDVSVPGGFSIFNVNGVVTQGASTTPSP